MRRFVILTLCQLILSCTFATNLLDTIRAVVPDDSKLPHQDLNTLEDQLSQAQMVQQMLGGVRDAVNLIEQHKLGDGSVLVFEVPSELLNILPEGCRTVGRASCIFYPLFASINFDTLTGRNDGKGYNFTVSLNIYNSESGDEEVKARTEMESMVLSMKLEKIKKRIHPNHDGKLSDIRIREWGAGGSYRYTAEWDGKEMVRYSSYYTGRVEDIFFTLEAEGDDIAVPQMVVEKLVSLARESMKYKSLKSRIVKE